MVNAMSESDVHKLISAVTSSERKARWIKNSTKTIVEKYEGDIPRNYQDLIALNGVGPKIATMTMRYCWNESVGIAVICNPPPKSIQDSCLPHCYRSMFTSTGLQTG